MFEQFPIQSIRQLCNIRTVFNQMPFKIVATPFWGRLRSIGLVGRGSVSVDKLCVTKTIHIETG